MKINATDDSINLSSGSIITLGGITIQDTADASSITCGGSLLTAGGASIVKRLYVGNGIVSTSSNTIGNIFTNALNTGFGTVNPLYTVDISGGIRVTQSVTTGSIFSNSGTFVTSISTAALYCTTSTIATLVIQKTSTGGAPGLLVTPQTTGGENFMMFNNTGMSGNNWMIGTPSGVTGGTFQIGYTSQTSTINCFTNGSLSLNGTITSNNDLYISSTSGIGNGNVSIVSGGSLNITGDVVISGTRGIHFTQVGLSAPTFSSRSLGTKITVDYSIGMENNNMWFSTSSFTGHGFKWYQGTTNTMSLQTNGSFNLLATSNATSVTNGGTLTVAGGTSIAKDLYIGGSIYVSGQNISSICGNATVGSFNGTGAYSVSNIPIGKTMSNVNYKLVGSMTTTSNNTNVYTVSFKNLTTTTFDTVIYRIDSLGSGWNDTNLVLSWNISP